MRKTLRYVLTGTTLLVILMAFSTNLTFAVWRNLGATSAGGDEQVCVDGMGIYLGDTTRPNVSVTASVGGSTLATANVTLDAVSTTQLIVGGGTQTFPFSGQVFLKWGQAVAAGSSIQFTVTSGSSSLSQSYVVQNCFVSIPPPPYNAGDDRLNPDALASAAVYCRAGGIEVWAIDTAGKGHLAIRLSRDQVATIPVPATNTLVTQALGVRLYRLSSGEFQINANPRTPASQLGGATTTTAPQTTTNVTTTVAGGSTVVHLVQKGENLFRISLRYKVPMATIAAANGITDFSRIYAGQKLVIPVGGTTVVTTTSAAPAVNTAAVVPTGPEYVFTWKGC